MIIVVKPTKVPQVSCILLVLGYIFVEEKSVRCNLVYG